MPMKVGARRSSNKAVKRREEVQLIAGMVPVESQGLASVPCCLHTLTNSQGRGPQPKLRDDSACTERLQHPERKCMLRGCSSSRHCCQA
eukprot:scaffold77074_cov20-Tisochrysis_lutea.AAC.1